MCYYFSLEGVRACPHACDPQVFRPPVIWRDRVPVPEPEPASLCHSSPCGNRRPWPSPCGPLGGEVRITRLALTVRAGGRESVPSKAAGPISAERGVSPRRADDAARILLGLLLVKVEIGIESIADALKRFGLEASVVLEPGQAADLAQLLQVQAPGLEVHVEGGELTVIAAPEVQRAIAGFIALMRPQVTEHADSAAPTTTPTENPSSDSK